MKKVQSNIGIKQINRIENNYLSTKIGVKQELVN